MSSTVDPPDEQRPAVLLAEALALFEREMAAGRAVEIEEFCDRYPTIRDRLRKAVSIAASLAKLETPGKAPLFQQAPETLGPYVIVRELGRGGMAPVFLAHDARLDREVALKVLLPDPVIGSARRERFLREARALARIDHPNVVPIHDVGEEGPWCYIAMERMHDSLSAHVAAAGDRDSPERVRRVLRWLLEACEGLAHVHGKGIVHRDLKPANLLLGTDGRVRIGDFGLARIEGTATLTQVGGAVGTPGFASPEQLHGQPPAPADDIYGLGASFYVLLTGKPPPDASQRPALPLSFPKGCPRAVCAVVSKAMELGPGRRYADATALARDLRACLEGRPTSAGGGFLRSRRAAAVLGIGIVIAVGAVLTPKLFAPELPGAYLLWRGSLDEQLPERVETLLATFRPDYLRLMVNGSYGEEVPEFQLGSDRYRVRIERGWNGGKLVLYKGSSVVASAALRKLGDMSSDTWRVLQPTWDVDGDGLPDVVLAGPSVFAFVKWDPSAWGQHELGWRVRAENPFSWSSILLGDWDHDGNSDVILGDARKAAPGQEIRSNIYVLDLATGRRKKSWNLAGQTLSAPAILEEASGGGARAIYVAMSSVIGSGRNATVYRLDHADGDPAAVLELRPGETSTPVLEDVNGDGEKEVLVAAMNGGVLYCLRSDLRGPPLWTFENGKVLGNMVLSRQGPSEPRDVCLGGEGSFRCLGTSPSLSTEQRVLWSAEVPADAYIVTAPIEIGDLNGDGHSELACGGSNHVYVLSRGASSGVLLDLEIPPHVRSAPAGSPNIYGRVLALRGADRGELSLLAVTHDGWVFCWRLRGANAELAWRFETRGTVLAAPELVEIMNGSDSPRQLVLIAGLDRLLYLLEPPQEAGAAPRIVWAFHAEASIAGHSRPYVRDGKPWVLFTDVEGRVYNVPIVLGELDKN